MWASAVVGNREVVNYNKIDSIKIVKQCDILCYSSSKERGTDEKFRTFFR
jgi:hypothetical protein